jgi:hypothetical protein
MRTIRASEIGAYLYCKRAWWYGRQGYESGNREELSSGLEFHSGHGRRVLIAGFQRFLAIVLLLAAVAVLTAYLTGVLLDFP